MAFLLRDKEQVWCSEFDVAWRYVFNRCLQTLCFSSFTCGRHLPDDNVIRYTVNQKRTQFGCSESLVLQPHNRDKESRSSALLRLRCAWRSRLIEFLSSLLSNDFLIQFNPYYTTIS